MAKQISARAFAGPELCRHPGWLEGCEQYNRDIFAVGATVRCFPRFLRPLVARFLPTCHALHQRLQDIQDLIQVVIDKRKANREARVAQGLEPETNLDLLELMESYTNSSARDIAILQLKGVLAAVNAVQEQLAQTVFNICAHPTLLPRLREEIISVIGQDGWQKTALHKLQLMDSVIKETIRLKPGTMGK
jgi:septum formation topological specificity factor MinE